MTRADAIREMRACGLDNPEALIDCATPEAIVAACRWWKAKKGVGTGLLVSRIRDGGITEAPPRADELRQRFQGFATRWPTGTVVSTHTRLQERYWPRDEPCPGDMEVWDTTYPIVALMCRCCGFEIGYPLRRLAEMGRGER